MGNNHFIHKGNKEGNVMILTTLEGVPGKTIREHFGLVQGSTIRAKHVGKDILAGLKKYCRW